MFATIPYTPKDAVFGVNERAKSDPHPDTVNLVIGAYRDDEGKPYVLPVVKEAERRLMQQNLDKEYLPIDGLKTFRDASVRLMLGDHCDLSRIASAQALSGTGSLTVAAYTLRSVMPNATVLISDPTWANHESVFRSAGFNVKKYRYFDAATNGVDMHGLLADLRASPDASIVVLHECAHNPTGADPSHEQWKAIVRCVKEKKHLALLDCAYQGYASGDLQKDAYAARLFYTEGLEFIVAQSFAKNMGLYSERCGCVFFVTASPDAKVRVEGLMKKIIRSQYSNPPSHGARIAALIMTTPELKAQWERELKAMADRIILMRRSLKDELTRLGTPGKWDHITNQIGMFSYLGLAKGDVEALAKHHVYLLEPGRASIAGLTTRTVPIVAKALDTVVRGRIPTSKI